MPAPASYRTLTLIPETGFLDAVVNRVVDGDTLDVFLLVPQRVRLFGVQVAEKNTDKGKVVIARLKDALEKQFVALTLHGHEKFGRLLADVKSDQTGDLAKYLIEHELAVAWDGQGKRPFGQAAPECGLTDDGEIGAGG